MSATERSSNYDLVMDGEQPVESESIEIWQAQSASASIVHKHSSRQ